MYKTHPQLFDFVRSVLVENSRTSKKEIQQRIINVSDRRLRAMTISSKEIRIGRVDPADEIPQPEIVELISQAGLSLLKTIPKGAGASGRYPTYVVTDDMSQETYNIVFAAGRNAGQSLEDEIFDEFKKLTSGLEPTLRLENILAGMNIDPSEVSDVEERPGRPPKRALSTKLQDIGEQISDITIVLDDGSREMISLKASSGDTFMNAGYGGAITVKQDEVFLKPHKLDDFLDALGIDKQKIGERLLDYQAGNKASSSWESVNADLAKVQAYLASGFGFGYWYVRAKGVHTFEVKDFNNPNNVLDFIGKVQNVELKYPGSSKQMSANIDTTNGRYRVEIRNSHGGIDPNEIKIKTR